MRMSRETLSRLSGQTGYRQEIIEKVSLLLVFGKGKYSIRTDKNPESGINCLASNVRVLQPVTSSGENDQMTMMN